MMQLLGTEQLAVSLRIATVVVPLAVYFFVLGYLNTRSRPQLLTGRQDTSILVVTLSPLALAPVVQYLGGGWVGLILAAAGLFGAIWLLSPRGHSWVVYNLTARQGRRILLDVCRQVAPDAELVGRTIELPSRGAKLELSDFPVLRNVSVRLIDGDDDLAGELESHLTGRLGGMAIEPAPMAVSLLLIATGMLLAPMALMIQHAPEIVRILSDILR